MKPAQPNIPVIVRFLDTDCIVVLARYRDRDRLAIRLVDRATHEPMADATVNIAEADVPPGHVLIKDYAENQGILRALVDAGVVEETGVRYTNDLVTVPLCRLLLPEPDNTPATRGPSR